MGKGHPPLPLHLHNTFQAHSGPVHAARLNSFGRYLLTGGADRQIHLFNVASTNNSSPIKTYNSHNGTVQSIDISHDNARFISGGEDRNVYIYDVGTGSVVRRFSAHQGSINAVSFCGSKDSPDDVVATAGYDASLRFYDMRASGAWKPIMECKDAKDAILCMAVANGLTANIWTGSVDGVVRTYDIRKGEYKEDVNERPITSLTPTATHSTLLVTTLARDAATSQGRASHNLLDLSDGSHLQTIQGGINKQYRCHSTMWAADSTIIAGDEEGRIRAWDVVTGEERKVAQAGKMKEHSKATLWVEATDKDGGRLVSTGSDGLVKVWGMQEVEN